MATIDDLLGSAGRSKVLFRVLLSLQEQEYELMLMQRVNQAEASEQVPGQAFAYCQRLDDLAAAQRRVLEFADKDVVDGLRRLTDGK